MSNPSEALLWVMIPGSWQDLQASQATGNKEQEGALWAYI